MIVSSASRVSARPPPLCGYLVCGGRLQANLNQTELIFSHPLFDGATHYGRNEDCEWLIEANYNQRVRAEFTFFALEADSSCNYDQTIVYDGPDETAAQLARLCGTDVSMASRSIHRSIGRQGGQS